jgi:hypothetical protein
MRLTHFVSAEIRRFPAKKRSAGSTPDRTASTTPMGERARADDIIDPWSRKESIVIKAGGRHEVIEDAEAGLLLLLHDVESGMVADLAVLEHTWRRKGQPSADRAAQEPEVKGHLLEIPRFRSYGGLQIRLSGASPIAIKIKAAELRLPGS